MYDGTRISRSEKASASSQDSSSPSWFSISLAILARAATSSGDGAFAKSSSTWSLSNVVSSISVIARMVTSTGGNLASITHTCRRRASSKRRARGRCRRTVRFSVWPSLPEMCSPNKRSSSPVSKCVSTVRGSSMIAQTEVPRCAMDSSSRMKEFQNRRFIGTLGCTSALCGSAPADDVLFILPTKDNRFVSGSGPVLPLPLPPSPILVGVCPRGGGCATTFPLPLPLPLPEGVVGGVATLPSVGVDTCNNPVAPYPYRGEPSLSPVCKGVAVRSTVRAGVAASSFAAASAAGCCSDCFDLPATSSIPC
mmetsp:Transcript_99351/g.285849  ORF Transcript_99351/g.285849 Transcript_99351/m.285849 type:complete len:309 (+) Transcript_99351:912-1838(+)